MSATSTTLPNSFSTPNWFVDKLMFLLDGDEYKVLSFAVRHILGWRSSFEDRQSRISLSMFEDGYTDGKGNRYEGCGLSRPRINKALKALVEYGALSRIGRATNDGQAWQLPIDDSEIDFDGLKARAESKKRKSKRRVAKAAAASADKRKVSGGTMDVLPEGYDGRTTSSTVDVPQGGTVDVHNQNHTKPSQSHVPSTAKNAVDGPPPGESPEPARSQPDEPPPPTPDELADAKQSHVAIIEDGYLAALDQLKRKPIEADPIKRRVKIASAIRDEGYTWRQVRDCVLWYYSDQNPDGFWKDKNKPIPLEDIAGMMQRFVETARPLPAPAASTYDPMWQTLSPVEQARLKGERSLKQLEAMLNG